MVVYIFPLSVNFTEDTGIGLTLLFVQLAHLAGGKEMDVAIPFQRFSK